MRTTLVVDDKLMAAAMKAGPFETMRETVEAGLKLISRKAAYREVLKWEGRLPCDDVDEEGQPATSKDT